MIRLNSDYNEGAHDNIINKLVSTNMEQTSNYGEDEYCEQAKEAILRQCESSDADVHFLMGGTQTNLVLIASALRSHHCVLCADTGHINVHETGAIEALGHKVIGLKSTDGKIYAKQVEECINMHMSDPAREHIVKPKMVYISNPTELGTIYSNHELLELSIICRKHQLYLYLDGARLAYALCARDSDLTLPLITKYCDAFYIGGTKCGALFGEALLINHPDIKEDFRYIMKQKGAMLAKGRLLGIQFLELFNDGLYLNLGESAVRYAIMMKNKFIELGYPLYIDSPTNQQFVIMPDRILKMLDEKYTYSFYMKYDEQSSVVRFCTSWATKEEDVIKFLIDLNFSSK